MIIVVGTYCKRASEFSKLDKRYEATVRLGATSTTGDPEGEIVPVSDRQPTEDEVVEALSKFTGQISQTPPSYSAIKINGVRAYKLAREGRQVEMPTRQVTIHDLKLRRYAYPDMSIDTHVSSGTYIRTLAEDLGRELGVGAYVTALRRMTVGEYGIEDAIALDTATPESLEASLTRV
jgi:tRNA pseudouridine55 synthase